MGSHKHWPEDHPFYERAPVHQTTKKECDRVWREYMHGHPDERCIMEVKPGNVKATCVKTNRDAEAERQIEKERREAAYQAFVEQERRRVATLLRER